MSSPSPDLEEHNIEDVVGGYYLFFQTLAELRDHIDTAPDIGDNSEKHLNTFLDQLESMFNVCWLFVCVFDCCCELSCCLIVSPFIPPPPSLSSLFWYLLLFVSALSLSLPLSLCSSLSFCLSLSCLSLLPPLSLYLNSLSIFLFPFHISNIDFHCIIIIIAPPLPSPFSLSSNASPLLHCCSI